MFIMWLAGLVVALSGLLFPVAGFTLGVMLWERQAGTESRRAGPRNGAG